MYSSFRETHLNEEVSLGILKHLNKEELQKLLDDDTKLSELINDDQQLRNFHNEKETLSTSNKSVAEYNLSREPRLAEGKRQLARTYEQAIEVQKEYDNKKQRIDSKSSQYNMDTILALLQTEAAKADESTEDMANNFMDGDMEVDNFIEVFIAQRKLAHCRRIKAEKMQELLRNGGQPTSGIQMVTANSVHKSQQVPPPPYTGAAGGWGAPYPASSMAMPNPASYLQR